LPELKDTYDTLKPKERDLFFRNLDVELSKAKILTWRDFTKNELQIIRRVPISNTLTEFEFTQLLEEMHFSAIIVWNTISRQLDQFGHSVTPPVESTSHKESLPPDVPQRNAKTIRQILTWIADNEKLTRYENGIKIDETGMETIEALVKSSDDFQDESAVEEVCKELSKSRRDPFVNFELVYGDGSFKGKRLKFLQDARVHAHIETNADALEYIHRTWGQDNGLPSKPYSPSPKFHPPNPREITQPLPRHDKAEPGPKVV
jgi:hypothetical protein